VVHPDEPHRPALFSSGERAGPPDHLPPPEADTFFDLPSGPAEMAPHTRNMLRRRRRVALGAFLAIAASVVLVGQFARNADHGRVTTIAPAATALPRPGGGLHQPSAPAGSVASAIAGDGTGSSAPAVVGPPPDTSAGRPARTPGTAGAFRFVTGYGPVLGSAGHLRRFRVAVEKSLDQSTGGDFADEIDRTLGDSRSWVASDQLRLQRVPATARAEFTVYLASPRTSTRMCAAGGVSTHGYSSCRLSGQVVINSDRWQNSVPGYGASREIFRAYSINHLVGHELGHGHEGCPGKGRPAPAMQQQTYDLGGCLANAWPYAGGERYTGPPIG